MQSLKILMAGALFCSSPLHAQASASREERLAGVLQSVVGEEQIGEFIKRCNNVEIEADKIIFSIDGQASLSVPAAKFFSGGFTIVKYGDTFRLLDQKELAKTRPGETLEDKACRILVSFGDFKYALRQARNNLLMRNIERQFPQS